MPCTNVNLLGSASATAIYENSKVSSKGRKCQRVEIAVDKRGIQLSIAMASKKIFKNPPKMTCFDKLFGRKYVNLQINTGERQGFIKVNAESLRKRLGISKEKFEKIVKESTHLDVTEAINKEISDLNLTTIARLDLIKNEIFNKLEAQTPPLYQIESGKIFLRFTPNERFDPNEPSFKKDFKLNGREVNEYGIDIRTVFSKQLDNIFQYLAKDKIITGPKPHIHYVVIYKKYDETFCSFSNDSSSSNINPDAINSLYSKFAGKPIVDEDRKEMI